MYIRTANSSDLEELAAVERECFPKAEAATEEEIRERLVCYADHFWLLFSEEEGRPDSLVGFADGMATDQRDLTDEMYERASLHQGDGAWQMIFGVNTRPAFRRRGYAALLIKRAISDAKEQGRKGLVLTCKEKLIPYYSKFGFVEEGISGSVHGNAVWHQMRLTF